MDLRRLVQFRRAAMSCYTYLFRKFVTQIKPGMLSVMGRGSGCQQVRVLP